MQDLIANLVKKMYIATFLNNSEKNMFSFFHCFHVKYCSFTDVKKRRIILNVTMTPSQKKGRILMKKLPLLLTCAVLFSTVPAQAKTVSVFRTVKVQTQKTTGDKTAITKNILKRFGIDLDKYNIPGYNSTPSATPVPTAAPTVKPTAAPTAKPTAAPTAKPTATPTAKPTTAPSNVTSEAAMEAEVLRIVNEERAKQGLGALKRASDLDAVARAHSADMINRHFFDHTNPDGKSPFDRLHSAGITYRAAGENIAYGQRDAQSVMTAWMNSSGHRKNILNSSYTEIGIAAVKNSGGTIYWTQVFVKR